MTDNTNTSTDFSANLCLPLTTPLDARLALVDYAKAEPDTLQQLSETALKRAYTYLDTIEARLKNDAAALSATDALAIIHEFDAHIEHIERAFGILNHLNHVVSSDALRDAHRAVLPQISAFYTRVGQSVTLYQLYRTLDEDFTTLPDSAQSDAQKAAITQALMSFTLSGVGLDGDNKAKFADIQSALSLASAKFSDNVLDATRHYVRPLHEHELAGISENGLALLKSAGDNYKKSHPELDLPTDYVATLDVPMYLAVMQFADNRDLRAELYHAYNTRASDQSLDTKDYDNADTMVDIVRLRSEKAALLGMNNYSDYSLATKMAKDSAEVEAFLLKIAHCAKPKATEEYAELVAFGRTLGLDEIEPWDVPYLSEKIRLAKYNFNSDALRPYFPLPVVMAGLFEICRRLFGIHIRTQDKASFSAWHRDVLFCTIENEKDNALLGGLYLDLFARGGKRGGAWLDGFQKRRAALDGTRLPVGFIVGNFAPPVGDVPSLLSFDEVTTLFHEFGHALHHLLTTVDVADVAGISGVEWDAVELPSQFMENFAITAEGIRLISRQVKTGESLPEDKLAALIAAKNFHTGLQTLRQMEFGLFDLRLHSTDEPASFSEILDILNQVREEVAVMMPPANNRFANSFSHIFAGGYACGYYSYMWAEVLSSDAFAKFEEDGIYNPTTGRAFRTEILARGSSRTALENYLAFRGREANHDALLRHRGL